MKLNRFILFGPTAAGSLLALTGGAWAASPYDTPYGIQWNFLIGHANADNPSVLTVSPDGTVWFTTGSANPGACPMLTWGSDKTTTSYPSSYASGYGQISRLGGILQGNDIPNVTGLSATGQTYQPTIAFAGNDPTAYFGGFNGNYTFNWTDASPADTVTSPNGGAMTFAISSALDQVGFEPFGDYTNAPGDPASTVLPRKNDPLDPTKKFSHRWVDPAADFSGGDFAVGTDGSYYIARGAAADSFTVGDFSGPAATSYKPCVGRISADGVTFSGPPHQPECGGRSLFTDVDINDSANGGAGKVYAAGYGYTSSGGTMNYLDPDGPGTDFAPIAFNASTPSNFKGFALVYNATTWAIDKVVTWESAQGYDVMEDITATADGGFVVVGRTRGDMGGFTNPAPGTFDAYMEVYDASGTLVWNYQTETADADVFSDVTVDSDGSIYVSGTSGSDPALWKFNSSGTLVWSKSIDYAGSVESQRDHGGDKHGIFFLSEHNPNSGGVTWPNTIAYVPQGTDESLLQKLSPGDFNSDGIVDFADVQIAGTASKPGLTGVDTYDFNSDGDSTEADANYMITNVMDRLVGDIAQDSLVSDVDNADIGRAIGAMGTGTLYLDGDLDWDGDVQSDDVTAVAAAFTGAKKPGVYANGTPGATLRYRPDDGQVWLQAFEASGGVITSFQLENAAGTFVPANFTGPSGGNFGGSLQEATANVLADTDMTLAGTSGTDGLISLGAVFPAGMDLAALEAYLKTAVYTGEPGSGQQQFTLAIGDTLPPFDLWTGGFPTLTKPYANVDFDGGGLDTGIEWVVGGDPTNPGDDASNLPTFDNSDPSAFKFVFNRRDEAAADTNTTIVVEYGTDLSTWRNTADHGVIDGVTTDDSVDLGGGFHQVTVSIPKTLAPDGRLFARLGVTGLPVSLLDEEFSNDNGGFTVATASGSAWEFGAPSTSDLGGGAVNSGNTGANCWGTNLNGAYIATTDTKLRSPVIDLTGVTTATLSFAQAIDILTPHTLVVNVIEEATDTVLQSAIHTSTPDANPSSAAWETINVTTPITGGQKVRIEWHFVGNGDGFYLGAYIDDVLVTSP